MEEFSEDEKEILRPFVTNIDRPIFVLKNLPEVVKGALFSRYSRSRKSLRRILLDEFILKPETGFKELVAYQKSFGEDETVAVKKAEEFYDRILLGFGDDSVAELGGAHLACEDISNIASKVLEASRIGLSPLEKSTRYVFFDEKIDGEYRYYLDPEIMESRFADLYVETNDLLFETYSRLIQPMIKYVEERFPQGEDISERAYRASVRAKACDILRVLLPASTLTNVGLFGNGRAFEYLLIKMYSHELYEIRNLAESIHQELAKVIPSFIRRADNDYGRRYQSYLVETRSSIDQLAKKILKDSSSDNMEPVTLVKYDTDAELDIVSAILYSYSTISLSEIRMIVSKMNIDQRRKIVEEYLSRRGDRRHKPGRALENTYYTFDLMANFGVYRDLQRHRILTQEHQHLTVDHGYDTPREIVEAGYKSEYDECMKQVIQTFRQISKTLPYQAQYIVAFGFKIRWYITLNLREAYHLVELRTVPQGHPDYRRLAQKIFRMISKVHPALTEYMKFVNLQEYRLGRLESEKKMDEKREKLKNIGS